MSKNRGFSPRPGKVWANTSVLGGARRKGSAAYSGLLAELERLSAARVVDLTRPGNMLLRPSGLWGAAAGAWT